MWCLDKVQCEDRDNEHRCSHQNTYERAKPFHFTLTELINRLPRLRILTLVLLLVSKAIGHKAKVLPITWWNHPRNKPMLSRINRDSLSVSSFSFKPTSPSSFSLIPSSWGSNNGLLAFNHALSAFEELLPGWSIDRHVCCRANASSK
jgi:hypothetical protein